MIRTTRWLPAGVLTAVLTAGLLLIGAPAFAAAPHDLGDEQVVDETAAGVDVTGIAGAIDTLSDRTGIELTVVFIDGFDGVNPIDWANSAAAASDRTGPTEVLLAIAIGDRGYGVSVDEGVGLSDGQLSSAEDRDLLPRLQENDWPGAVIAYARALGDLATGEDTGSAAIHDPSGGDATAWLLPVVGTSIVVLVGGAFLVAWLRGRRRNRR